LAYTAVAGGYSVSYGTATATEIVIPRAYNGQSVIKIGEEGFLGTNITAIYIPDSATRHITYPYNQRETIWGQTNI
jgi:hypothetical protein